MPKDNRGQNYRYKSSGKNAAGNHYCSRDKGPGAKNSNPYHYSNGDGSYYYYNSNGSRFYCSGKGSAWYTPPNGRVEKMEVVVAGLLEMVEEMETWARGHEL
jgi:hypothetical protein